jgi:hypothetical protein
MLPWSLVALGCLVAGGLSFVLAEGALVDMHEVAALCWFASGLVGVQAAFAISGKRAP